MQHYLLSPGVSAILAVLRTFFWELFLIQYHRKDLHPSGHCYHLIPVRLINNQVRNVKPMKKAYSKLKGTITSVASFDLSSVSYKSTLGIKIGMVSPHMRPNII